MSISVSVARSVCEVVARLSISVRIAAVLVPTVCDAASVSVSDRVVCYTQGVLIGL